MNKRLLEHSGRGAMWALRKASALLRIAVATMPLVLAACGGGGGGGSAPSQVNDPNVQGDTQAAATAAITAAGLTVGTITMQASSTVAAGDIISESPVAGTSLSSGTAINLIVSSGPAPVSVPSVVTDTQAAATTAITGAGLVVGTVTMQSSTTVAAGSVISESPVAGTNVASGSSVNLVVSNSSSSGYTVGGNIVGLSTSKQESSLVLSDGTSTTTGACPGLCTGDPFVFSPLPTGTLYTVSVVTQPAEETCSVTQGATGTVGTSNITNVMISCLAGSWTSLSTMPFARGHMAVAVLNNLIYTIAGDTNDNSQTRTCYNTVSVYDPSANAWSLAAQYPITGFVMGAVAINGNIYVFGGTDCNNNSNSVSTVYEYDPIANAWTAVSTMPYGGGALTNVGVGTDGTYAYVFGGINAASVTYSQSIQIYDPSTNSWSSPAFTAPPMAGAAAVWQSNGTGGGDFLVVPGYGPSGPLSNGYQYFPDSNAGFTYPVPFATDFPAAAAVGSNIYALAGATVSSAPQFYQLPKTQLAPPTAQRYGASAAVANGVFYLIGGILSSQPGQGTGAVESYQPCTDLNSVSICVGPQ